MCVGRQCFQLLSKERVQCLVSLSLSHQNNTPFFVETATYRQHGNLKCPPTPPLRSSSIGTSERLLSGRKYLVAKTLFTQRFAQGGLRTTGNCHRSHGVQRCGVRLPVRGRCAKYVWYTPLGVRLCPWRPTTATYCPARQRAIQLILTTSA